MPRLTGAATPVTVSVDFRAKRAFHDKEWAGGAPSVAPHSSRTLHQTVNREPSLSPFFFLGTHPIDLVKFETVVRNGLDTVTTTMMMDSSGASVRFLPNLSFLLVTLLCVGALAQGPIEGSHQQHGSSHEGPRELQVIVFPPSQFAPRPPPTPPPTLSPTAPPTPLPTLSPTTSPTISPAPTFAPTKQPTIEPSSRPSMLPSSRPSMSPSGSPTLSSMPSLAPSQSPSKVPSQSPSLAPSVSFEPTVSSQPSFSPTLDPYGIMTRFVTGENGESEIVSRCRLAIPNDNAVKETVQDQSIEFAYDLNVEADGDIKLAVEYVASRLHRALSDIFLECRFDEPRDFHMHALSSAPSDAWEQMDCNVENADCYRIDAIFVAKLFYVARRRQLQEDANELITDGNLAASMKSALEFLFESGDLTKGLSSIKGISLDDITNRDPSLEPESSSPNIPVIAGSVAGGLVGCIAIGILAALIRRRRKKPYQKNTARSVSGNKSVSSDKAGPRINSKALNTSNETSAMDTSGDSLFGRELGPSDPIALVVDNQNDAVDSSFPAMDKLEVANDSYQNELEGMREEGRLFPIPDEVDL